MTITDCMEFYLERAKYNYEMANTYSWRRWEIYNSLRLHRAHNYLEYIGDVLTGKKKLNKHNLARIGGAGTWLSQSMISPEFLDDYGCFCRQIGWARHLFPLCDIVAAYRYYPLQWTDLPQEDIPF